MSENLKPILIDTRLKIAWLRSLSIASSIILSGNDLPSKAQCESVALYLIEITSFIATELEEDISKKVMDLYRVDQDQGMNHE